uniref:COesterase domain-containing protein n=1 Tax=Heligmosomoides polygyrus TaxID=6339 RepID=A0A183GAJ9_HELPZ
LFQQVIALSPTINYRVTSSRLDLTWRFAHEIGCAVNRTRPVESAHSEIEDVVDCLRRIDTSDLLAMQRLIEERDGLMFDGILYGPPFVDEDTPHSVFVLGSSNRRMMCGSTKFEFNMDKNDSQYDIGTFLQVAHPELVRRKYLHDKEQGIPDNYLSQVVFSNNVIFGSVFTAKGSDVYLMEFGQKPNPMHASDLPFFIGVHMRNFTEDEKLIDRFYATSIINFIHGRVPSDGEPDFFFVESLTVFRCRSKIRLFTVSPLAFYILDWLPFDPAKRNYYSVEADIRKGIYPSNKLNYHYEVVDYWLRNMTSFDKALSDVLRFDLYDVIPSASTARTMASIVLFGLALLLLLFVLMAACSTLSASDPPNHEQVPLVHHKPSQITRKDTVVVSALKAR